MLKEERYYLITEYLQEVKTALYSEIAKAVDFSEGTVRKDVVELEKRGVLNVVRGGATIAKTDQSRDAFSSRIVRNPEKKENLAQSLGDYVKNGYALFLNGGATQIYVINYLIKNYRRLTIITNNLHVADVARTSEDYTVIIPGGIYNSDENTVTGKNVEKELAIYNADIAILAVNAISIEKGITEFRMDERGIMRVMYDNSKRTIIVADSTKFDQTAYINIFPLENIDTVLTDAYIDDDVLKKYRDAGLNVQTGPAVREK